MSDGGDSERWVKEEEDERRKRRKRRRRRVEKVAIVRVC